MEKIITWLKENLSDERFLHTLGTAKTAKELAQEFNEDCQKAEIAGLLHDCAKELSIEQMLKIIEINNLEVTPDELHAPKVLHAPVSAYLAQSVFGINDEGILSAIRFHTIGRIGMTNFEKIIYLADKIEPETRKEACFEKLRNELKTTNSLDATLLLCSKMTINSLLERNLTINFQTIDLYNYLLKNAKKIIKILYDKGSRANACPDLFCGKL